MQPTWIVVADGSRARVFELQRKDLSEIAELVNPAARNKDADLRTDARGRFNGSDGQGHTAEPAVTPKEHETELFALSIAKYLDDARTRNKYTKLQLIAGPEFLGVIRRNLDKNVADLIEHELPKNLGGNNVQQIGKYIKYGSRPML
jgi:protein required for attachment to host cells